MTIFYYSQIVVRETVHVLLVRATYILFSLDQCETVP